MLPYNLSIASCAGSFGSHWDSTIALTGVFFFSDLSKPDKESISATSSGLAVLALALLASSVGSSFLNYKAF